MKRIWKWTSALLALTLGLTLAACSGQNTGEGEQAAASVSTESTSPQNESATFSDTPDTPEQSQEGQSEESTEESESILVAYFSATGNTEAVAQTVAGQLGSVCGWTS